MKRLTILFFLLTTLCGISCNVKEPKVSRYLFDAYFVPNKASVNTIARKSFTVQLDGEHIKQGSTLFTSLSKEYGDTGEDRQLYPPPYPKPYNITNLRILQGEGAEIKDVSSEFSITFKDFSEYVASKYSKGVDTQVTKKVSDLTDHDYKWIFFKFNLESPERDNTNLTLEVVLKDAQTFKVKL